MCFPDSNRQYPVAIEAVKRIKAMNMKGVRVDELETTDVNSSAKKESEPQFVELVGQISLKTLERNSQKRKQKDKDQREPREQRNPNVQRDKDQRPKIKRITGISVEIIKNKNHPGTA
jgi:hypothetical protein